MIEVGPNDSQPGGLRGRSQQLALTGSARISAKFPLLEVDRKCCGGVGPSQFDPKPSFRMRNRIARVAVRGPPCSAASRINP